MVEKPIKDVKDPLFRYFKSRLKDLDEVTAAIATRKWSTISNLLLAEANVALDPGETAALDLGLRLDFLGCGYQAPGVLDPVGLIMESALTKVVGLADELIGVKLGFGISERRHGGDEWDEVVRTQGWERKMKVTRKVRSRDGV